MYSLTLFSLTILTLLIFVCTSPCALHAHLLFEHPSFLCCLNLVFQQVFLIVCNTKKMEFFLNGAHLSLNSVNSDKSLKHELASIYRSYLSHMCCWCCDSILVCYARGGRFEPFYCNVKYFVTEITTFSEKKLGKTPISPVYVTLILQGLWI